MKKLILALALLSTVSAVQAKSVDDVASFSGSYICGASSGVSVDVAIEQNTILVNGYLVHRALFSVRDEAGKVLYSGSESIGSQGVEIVTSAKTMFTIDHTDNAIKVFKVKNGILGKELFYCGM